MQRSAANRQTVVQPQQFAVLMALAPRGPVPVVAVQREFAVQVTIDDTKGTRVVRAIDFGERPHTQFGKRQEDHVLAWTVKLNAIRLTVVGYGLRDAAARLITIVDDEAGSLTSLDLMDVAHGVGQAVQRAKDDLDLHQAIQGGSRKFLEDFNKHPR